MLALPLLLRVIHASSAEAKFDKGVLHIHSPKPAEAAQKQQKIEIKKG
jgi:HSP20 family molecular chaperone IbpA